MPKLCLSERTIHELKPDPSGKPTIYFDTDLKGFGVRVSGATASTVYIAQWDINGKTRRVTVGATNTISLKEAKKKAAKLLLQMRNGIDPKAERRAVEAARRVEIERQISLRAAATAFLQTRRTLNEKSRRDYDRTLSFFEAWLDKPLRDITREMVEQRHKAIAKEINAKTPRYSGMIMANAAMRTLRAIWNYAAEKGYDLQPNPVKLRRQWFEEKRRERHVPANQLAKFYAAVNSLPNDVARDYLIFLLFTGCRRSEAASLTWEDIDLDNGTLRIPGSRTKSRRALALPLSDVVFEMLKARRMLGKTKFVFPAKGESGHIAEPKFPLRLVAEKSGAHVSPHDLRRTFLTVAEACGIDGYTLKALVNHSAGGDVTAGYVILSVERLREPVQRVADKMKRLCGIESGKVVALRANFQGKKS